MRRLRIVWRTGSQDLDTINDQAKVAAEVAAGPELEEVAAVVCRITRITRTNSGHHMGRSVVSTCRIQGIRLCLVEIVQKFQLMIQA